MTAPPIPFALAFSALVDSYPGITGTEIAEAMEHKLYEMDCAEDDGGECDDDVEVVA